MNTDELVAFGLDDIPDARVSERAAHEGDIEHPRQPYVGNKSAAATQITVVLQTQDRRTNAFVLVFGFPHRIRTPLL